MQEDTTRRDDPPENAAKDSNDPKEAPVDGPGGDEDEGGLGASSQGSPGDVGGGGTSGV